MLNTGDNTEQNSIYLTVSGTSAESGDDGEVGRGNRANGLISPHRPLNLEAISGKNPVTHVGKIYNWISMKIAEEIAGLDEVVSCSCFLVSRIGSPVHEPHYTEIRLETAEGHLSDATEKAAREITAELLLSIRNFGKKTATEGKILFI